ncbi:MAG: DUF4080 domain-containing protein [Candidatus Cloacimonetes bacterium]|nr:DUF4080 domain-containing protein [Candidatus Cloacimonadota bacterium]
MKILFLGINARYTHSNLALYYLRNSILGSDYEWEILETSINADELETTNIIFQHRPDVLCLSVYIWNTLFVSRLLPLVRIVLPKTIIVAGGPEITYPNPFIETLFPYIDFAIQGAGEKAFKHLSEQNFQHSEKFFSIPATSFRDIPFPYLPSDAPLLKNKYVYYESSRGCPFQCSFCLSSRTDVVLEYKALETVKEELKQLIALEPRLVKFVDRSFNADRIFAREIWRYLIELNPGITFHFEIKPDLLQDEDIEVLSKAPVGLFQFEIGLQSTHPTTLETINRANNFETIKPYLIRVNRLENIHTHLDLIIGLPYDTITSFGKSFNDAISTLPRYLQLGFLKVLPGTEIAKQESEFKLKAMPYPPYQLLKNKWLSFEELMNLEQFTHWFDLFYNSEKMTSTLHYIIEQIEDPYHFFSELFNYCTENGLVPHKDYYAAFSYLTEFISWKYHSFVDYLLDSLLYDWCVNVHSPKYPPQLRIDSSNILKNEIYAILRTNPDALPQELLSAKPYFKKALFAQFSNNEFITSKLSGKSRMVVYQDDGLHLILW